MEIEEIPIKTERFLDAEADRNLKELDEGLTLTNKLILSAVAFLLVNRSGNIINSEENISRSVFIKGRVDEIFATRYEPRIRKITSDLRRQETFFKRTYDGVGAKVVYKPKDTKTFTQRRKDNLKILQDEAETSKEFIKTAVSDGVLAEQPFKDMDEQIEQLVIGGTEKKGRSLKQNVDVLTQDMTMGYYRIIGNSAGENAGLTKALYFGDIIKDSRPFCIQRVGRTYTIEQIKGWRSLDWAGKRGDPVIYQGGWNCRHSYVWIKPEWEEEGLIETE